MKNVILLVWTHDKKIENLKNGASAKKLEVKKSTAGWTMNYGCFITLA